MADSTRALPHVSGEPQPAVPTQPVTPGIHMAIETSVPGPPPMFTVRNPIPSVNDASDMETIQKTKCDASNPSAGEAGSCAKTCLFNGAVDLKTCLTINKPRTASKSQCFTFFDKWWYWEITCGVFGIVILVGAIILLTRIDGLALADWHFRLQPTTLLAACMTVSKSAFLVLLTECVGQAKWVRFARSPLPLAWFQDYDEATRGPFGSLSLLMRGPRVGSLALSGAFLILLALGLDAFAQQVVQYNTRRAVVPEGIATLSLVQNLTHFDHDNMEGGILNGIYQETLPHSTYRCSTGDCEWPAPLATLGVCSRSRNITTLVSPSCSAALGPLQPSINDMDAWSFQTTNCSYSINEDIHLPVYIQHLSFPPRDGRPAEFTSQWTQYKIISPPVESGLGAFISDGDRWIATMLSYATTYSRDTNPLPPITVELLEPSLYACGLFWCAQIYDSPVAVDGMAPSNTSADFRLSALQGPGGDITVESSTGLLNVLQAQSSDVAEFPSSVNPNFTVKANSHLVLTRYLEDLFNISQTNGNDAFAVFPEPQFGLAGISDAIYTNGEDPSDTFARIASGMTEQIRSSMSSYVAAGNSFGPETYIDIEWPWMAFPIGVFVLATVLLTTSIFASRSSKGMYHRVWKSSALSLLLHNLEDVHVDRSALAGLQELNCFAESLEVKLSNRDSDDMRFVRE
ncbi:hypothetical protein AB5N19_03476 [Seiridium cardinale]